MGAEFANEMDVVRYQDHGIALSLLQQLLPALALELRVSHREHLVDQIAVEIDGERESERDSCPHPGRIGCDGHAHVLAQLRELLGERIELIEGAFIQPGEEAYVV